MPDMNTQTINGVVYNIADKTARENLAAHTANQSNPHKVTAAQVGAPTMAYAKKVGDPYSLLDNGYFKNPVNQRNAGGTYGVWGGYTIDRWFAGEKGATLTLYEDSIGLKGGGDIAQIIPNPQKLSGKKLTFAAKIYGRIFCCSGTVNYSNSWARVANYSVANDVAIEILTQSNNDLWVHIANNGANETYLEWAALYEGEYTAETLPEYQPKGYAAELMECRRYYRRKRGVNLVGYVNGSSKGILYSIENDEPFYKVPTMNIISMTWIRGLKSDGTGVNLTSIPAYTISRYSNNNISPVFSFDTDTNLGFPAYSTVFTYCEYELTADL